MRLVISWSCSHFPNRLPYWTFCWYKQKTIAEILQNPTNHDKTSKFKKGKQNFNTAFRSITFLKGITAYWVFWNLFLSSNNWMWKTKLSSIFLLNPTRFIEAFTHLSIYITLNFLFVKSLFSLHGFCSHVSYVHFNFEKVSIVLWFERHCNHL